MANHGGRAFLANAPLEWRNPSPRVHSRSSDQFNDLGDSGIISCSVPIRVGCRHQISGQLRQLGIELIQAVLLPLNFINALAEATGGLLYSIDGLQSPAEVTPSLAQLDIELGSGRLAPQLNITQRRFMDGA